MMPTVPVLEWLRPMWLWGFLPLLLLLIWQWQRRQRNCWEKLVDPELQSYVMEAETASGRWRLLLTGIAWALTLLALAGPVWQQREVPVFAAEQPQLILFDLTRSMLVDDIAPDRLTRARFKLTDLLQRSQGRQTGLIAFAERPYVISPLSDDAATIEAFVASLSPEIMPVQGSRPDLAIARGIELLQQAGAASGHIILMTDSMADAAAVEVAARARDNGYRLSVLAVGTTGGAPLRGVDGQFLRDASGSIVMAELDSESLQRLAAAGGGTAVSLSASTSDLEALDEIFRRVAVRGGDDGAAARKIFWVEYSPWLLWPLMLLVLLAFRRGETA